MPTNSPLPDDEAIDGLEYLRRNVFRLSKSAFYDGPARELPVVQLSAQRKGVRRGDWRAWIASRTRQPQAA